MLGARIKAPEFPPRGGVERDDAPVWSGGVEDAVDDEVVTESHLEVPSREDAAVGVGSGGARLGPHGARDGGRLDVGCVFGTSAQPGKDGIAGAEPDLGETAWEVQKNNEHANAAGKQLYLRSAIEKDR